MAGVVRLTDKLSQITMGEGTGCDLFSSLKEFFSLQTVQDKMLSLNKDRLDAEGTNRLGASMPSYSNSWKNRKQRQGVAPHTGAWIETSIPMMSNLRMLSHLIQVRGLKQQVKTAGLKLSSRTSYRCVD